MKALRYAWGVPVAVAILLATGMIEGEKPEQLTMEEWQKRVGEHIASLNARCLRLESEHIMHGRQMAECRTAISSLDKEQKRHVAAVSKEFGSLNVWVWRADAAISALSGSWAPIARMTEIERKLGQLSWDLEEINRKLTWGF